MEYPTLEAGQEMLKKLQGMLHHHCVKALRKVAAQDEQEPVVWERQQQLQRLPKKLNRPLGQNGIACACVCLRNRVVHASYRSACFDAFGQPFRICN